MKRLTVNGVTLGVREEGTGTPLVFLHGFPLDHSMWSAQIEAFAPEYHVIAPDLRGQGTSELGAVPITMRQMAADLAALLEALEVSEKACLCGLSMGGYIAWEFWRHHRDRLAKLILCDTRASADPPEVARAREMMAVRATSGDPQVAVTSMLPKLFASRTYQDQPKLVEQVRAVMAATSPESIAALQRAMAAREDMTGQLRAIDLPTLVLCGADDPITPSVEMQEMAGALPHGTFVEIPGAGHLPPLEQPLATTEALRRFL